MSANDNCQISRVLLNWRFFLALGTLGKVGKKKGGILRESWRTESWRKYLVTVKKLYSLGHFHPSTPNV